MSFLVYHKVIPFTKFEQHFGIIRFRVMLWTNKQTGKQTDGLERPTIQVRYRKDPLSQRSAHAEQYAQTKTNPNPDHNRYRRRCPDPNARIQKFIHYTAIAAICDSGPLQ